MYVFKGSPTTSATPCPGGVDFGDNGSCPVFKCNDVDVPCLNSGTCKDEKCNCDTGFKGIDCALYECTDDNTGNSLRGIVNWSGAA